jgi:hypothetical protein
MWRTHSYAFLMHVSILTTLLELTVNSTLQKMCDTIKTFRHHYYLGGKTYKSNENFCEEQNRNKKYISQKNNSEIYY